MSVDTTPNGYPVQVITIGDYIGKACFDRGLWHKQVAEIIGVTVSSINNWEHNHAEPKLRYIPAIIKFLGYNPVSCPDDVLERLRWYKWTSGLSYGR